MNLPNFFIFPIPFPPQSKVNFEFTRIHICAYFDEKEIFVIYFSHSALMNCYTRCINFNFSFFLFSRIFFNNVSIISISLQRSKRRTNKESFISIQAFYLLYIVTRGIQDARVSSRCNFFGNVFRVIFLDVAPSQKALPGGTHPHWGATRHKSCDEK